MADLFTAENLAAFLTLAGLEIVLGIDNIVFIAIVADRVEPAKQPAARRIGLLAGMFGRIALLLCIAWIMGLTSDLFTLVGKGISGKDIILFLGGMFLLFKATREIHHKLEGPDDESLTETRPHASFAAVIGQIMLIDLVFSLDSVITAVGMVKSIAVMVAAIIVAVSVMMLFAESISGFIKKHPSMKMLALSFLILIGVLLVADAFDQHIPRGYIYFAMTFSLIVEMLNIRARSIATDKKAGAQK